MDKIVRDQVRQYLSDAAGYATDAKNLLRRKNVDVREVERKIAAARVMLNQAWVDLVGVPIDIMDGIT